MRNFTDLARVPWWRYITKGHSYIYKSKQIMASGPWFNIKMSPYQYRKSYCGDKTVARLSNLHNVISYTGTMSSLYWIRAWMFYRVCKTIEYLDNINCWVVTCFTLENYNILPNGSARHLDTKRGCLFGPISQIPQCFRQISHHALFSNRNMHTYTFLLRNSALLDTGLVHCGICARGLLQFCVEGNYTCFNGVLLLRTIRNKSGI